MKRQRIEIDGWSWAINRWHEQTTMHAVKGGKPVCGSNVHALTGIQQRYPQIGNVCLKCQHIVNEKGPDYNTVGYPVKYKSQVMNFTCQNRHCNSDFTDSYGSLTLVSNGDSKNPVKVSANPLGYLYGIDPNILLILYTDDIEVSCSKCERLVGFRTLIADAPATSVFP